ncbi:hypothetical protein RRG08_019192, partial [Elysia crispata]
MRTKHIAESICVPWQGVVIREPQLMHPFSNCITEVPSRLQEANLPLNATAHLRPETHESSAETCIKTGKTQALIVWHCAQTAITDALCAFWRHEISQKSAKRFLLDGPDCTSEPSVLVILQQHCISSTVTTFVPELETVVCFGDILDSSGSSETLQHQLCKTLLYLSYNGTCLAQHDSQLLLPVSWVK